MQLLFSSFSSVIRILTGNFTAFAKITFSDDRFSLSYPLILPATWMLVLHSGIVHPCPYASHVVQTPLTSVLNRADLKNICIIIFLAVIAFSLAHSDALLISADSVQVSALLNLGNCLPTASLPAPMHKTFFSLLSLFCMYH